MTCFWFVRHGPTHQRGMVGWSDVPADLSDTAAIGRLSDYLPDAPVISSDLDRCIQTANALQSKRPRLPHDPELRELNFGDWELKTADEVEAVTPGLIRTFWDEPEVNCAPNGETWGEMSRRVTGAVDRLAEQHDEDLIVVAHFGVILSQLHRARGCTLSEILAQKIDNLSVTCLAYDGAWSAEVINHIP